MRQSKIRAAFHYKDDVVIDLYFVGANSSLSKSSKREGTLLPVNRKISPQTRDSEKVLIGEEESMRLHYHLE